VTSLVPTTNVQTKTVTEQGSTLVSSFTETIIQIRVVTTEMPGGFCKFLAACSYQRVQADPFVLSDTTTMLVPMPDTNTLDQSKGGSAQVSTKTIVQSGTTIITQVPVTQTLTQVLTTTIVGNNNGRGSSSSVESGSMAAATDKASAMAIQSSGGDTASQGVSLNAVQGGYITATAQQPAASQVAQVGGTANGPQEGVFGTGW
jgi:hypothetical protein